MANLNVKTSFNTILNLNTDVIGKRVSAAIIDLLVMLLYVFIIIWIASFFNFDVGSLAHDDASRVYWGLYSILSLPLLFYTLISEVVSGGYTVGKYLVKIKVVKVDGFQPSFIDFFIRWIFRMVDVYFFFILAILFGNKVMQFFTIYMLGIVGLLGMMKNGRGQRLGDLVAGTAVIRAKIKQDMSITILQEIKDDYKPTYAQVIKLSDNDARIIKETYEAAKKINDYKLIRKLVAKLEDVMKIECDRKPNDFIETVLKDFNYYTQSM
jgi:uncharacterized RDD family membrane protein YckC